MYCLSSFFKNKLYIVIIIIFSFTLNGIASLTHATVNKKRISFSIDFIPSLSFNTEYGINSQFGIGGSLGLFNDSNQILSKNFINNDEDSYLETHLLYCIKEYDNEIPMYISLLGGLWGTQSKLSLQLGLLLDIPLSYSFKARFNLIFGPRAGIEIAYIFNKNYELCFDLAIGVGVIGLRAYL